MHALAGGEETEADLLAGGPCYGGDRVHEQPAHKPLNHAYHQGRYSTVDDGDHCTFIGHAAGVVGLRTPPGLHGDVPNR